ncbi:MAG: molybdopterin molybdotransferase MoeA [Defluviitaleaceae bacterium]|nr:molybdopterin molybdotransferase MoeA [Defluviitaleaceae bacterium]
MSIELEQAVEIILSHITPICDTESVELESPETGHICGRICAQNIKSPLDLPPFNRSPLDGYAFCATDSIGASKQTPVSLKVIEDISVGQCAQKEIVPKTAIRLATGSPIPDGANCVIRREDTKMDTANGSVNIFKELSAYDNFCRKGETISHGETIVKSGERLNYAHAGFLAGVGIDSVTVYRKPRILILETGDELFNKNPGQILECGNLPPGKIHSMNYVLLSARLREFGVQVLNIGTCEDNSKVIAQKIADAAFRGDIMITTGGVSVGRKDLIPQVMKNFLNANILFHGVKIKPGAPAMFSIYNKLPIFSLSGNPFAAITTLELLVRPALAVLSHNKDLNICHAESVLENDFPKSSPTRRFVRGIEKNGCVHIADIRYCNCLVDIPAKSQPLKAGEKVRIWRI